MSKKHIGVLFAVVCLFGLAMPFLAYSETVTIVYSGNSYSSLYPCGTCKASAGGGLSRRATAIRQLRKSEKNLLIVDSGNFTGGGIFDLGSINPNMDKNRSSFYAQAMNEIGYDVVGVGDNEFIFGKDFLISQVERSNFKYVSSNLKLPGVLPYYISKVSGLRIAFVGLSPKSIYKKYGVKVVDYQSSLRAAVEQLEGRFDLLVLVSSLGTEQNYSLVDKFPQINLILSSGPGVGVKPYEQINKTLIFSPHYQAKELSVIRIDVKDKGIVKWSLDSQKLPISLTEDKAIKKSIPACFQDKDCTAREGLVSRCQEAGGVISSCIYYDVANVEATIITEKDCFFCSTAMPKEVLKTNFLGITFDELDYRDSKAKEIIRQYNIGTLPVFIVDPIVREDKNFEKLKVSFEEKNGKLLLKNDFSGIFLYLGRQEKPRKIDLFVDFYEKGTGDVFSSLVQFAKKNKIDLSLYFVFSDNQGKGAYPKEELEVVLAVAKMYPKKLNDYIGDRILSIKRTSWISTGDDLGIDYKRIKQVINSSEMNSLITKNAALAKELKVRDGNVILIKNNRIFKALNINPKELENFFEQGGE